MHTPIMRPVNLVTDATARVAKVAALTFCALAVTSALAIVPANAAPKNGATAKTKKQVAAPITMVISLNQQRMYVYDKNGYVTQTRVSTGKTGHETPKGIYTIIQKKVDHSSNIYLGAKMPYMQRLLQTGIAMHGGVVPGYPASHGCIRLPYSFAPKLFAMTTMNERVVVTPEPQSPIPFAHEKLFSALPKGRSKTASLETGSVSKTDVAAVSDTPTLSTIEVQLRREREDLVAKVATEKSDAVARRDELNALKAEEKSLKKELWKAKKVAKKASRGVWKLNKKKRTAERNLKKLKKRIAWAEKKKLRADKLEKLRKQEEKNLAVLEEVSNSEKFVESEAAKAEVNKIAKELSSVRKERKAVNKQVKSSSKKIRVAEKAVTAFDRRQKKRHMPISMVITPRDGKIKIRQGWETVMVAPVEIEDPDQEIGTHLYTATAWRDDTETGLVWQALSVGENNRGYASKEKKVAKKSKRKKKRNKSMPVPRATDEAAATAALSRIKIPKETRIKIAALVKPGSTLIVSDFDIAKSEVRPGTDYTVQMPEVVAKITRPTAPRRPVDDYYGYGSYGTYSGNWSFFSAPPPRKYRRKYRRARVRNGPGPKKYYYNGW